MQLRDVIMAVNLGGAKHSVKGIDELGDQLGNAVNDKLSDFKRMTSLRSACFCWYCSMWTINVDKDRNDTVLFACWDFEGTCCLFFYLKDAATLIFPRMCHGWEEECLSCKGDTCNCIGKPFKIGFWNCECFPFQSSFGFGCVPIPKTCCYYIGNTCCCNHGCAFPCTKEVPCEVGCCGIMCIERKDKSATLVTVDMSQGILTGDDQKLVGAGGDHGPPGEVMPMSRDDDWADAAFFKGRLKPGPYDLKPPTIVDMVRVP